MQHYHQQDDHKKLALFLVIGIVILSAWYYFYEKPRLEVALAEQQRVAVDVAQTTAKQTATKDVTLTREEALAASPRIQIDTPTLRGSIALRGARIDDLQLKEFSVALDQPNTPVTLLNPAGAPDAYFSEHGWLSSSVAVPNNATLWHSDNTTLSVDSPVTLTWDNGQGLRFEQTIAVDEHYMFTITQRVVNTSATDATVAPYGLLARQYVEHADHFFILHEGALGVLGGELRELTYADLRENGTTNIPSTKGWAGITDKYWLASLIGTGEDFTAQYQYYTTAGKDWYQADTLYPAQQVAAGKQAEHIARFYAGAKKLTLLDAYAEQYNIPLFDRAIDFGMLYFMTRPIFMLLNMFYHFVGNFGIAILLLTVCIKLLMYPLANKSYRSMAQMKKLTPKMTELRERHGDDRLKLNQEMMALYKREKVNPAAGCLPMLVQIPVFFALYKVLFVTIEMRHAPFYGWIQDLSEKDPTNIFTLFDLIPWDAPDFLHIGLWPLLMTGTMILQQKMNPKPADPVQAQVMGLMPYMFLFLFATFPAGLVIYWAWNNLLSVAQQWIITKRMESAPTKTVPANTVPAKKSKRKES